MLRKKNAAKILRDAATPEQKTVAAFLYRNDGNKALPADRDFSKLALHWQLAYLDNAAALLDELEWRAPEAASTTGTPWCVSRCADRDPVLLLELRNGRYVDTEGFIFGPCPDCTFEPVPVQITAVI